MSNSKNSKKISFVSRFWVVVIIAVVMSGLVADKTVADSGKNNFYEDVIRLENVTNKIHQGYVKEIPSEDLVDNAIEGMLGILDPHTTYFKKKDFEELKIHTEGKFGGLGIQISIRDQILTVMTPISGTPASRIGIQSGDKIIKIEGKSTKGITIEQAVAKLRGEPGTAVTITVLRKGEAELLDFTITRAIIEIHSVPFAGILDGDIGYVRLLTFSEDAGDEVGAAIEKILSENPNLKGMIFDLRFNPGGLLNQAVSVAEKFIDKGQLVVSTRGRSRLQDKSFSSQHDPILPKKMPLVVLVNAASASAAEIVSGAIQDWDRGVLLGDTTYGKGSVQSIIPLDPDHHIKMTTAFYYTPSGRCINKPINGIKGTTDIKDFFADDSADSKTEVADTAIPDSMIFHTEKGRVVYGGGGVIPDTIVDPADLKFLVRTLVLKDAFFKFVNQKYPALKKKKTAVNKEFEISDKLFDEFKTFLDSINFEFKSPAKARFEDFKKRSGFMADTSLDSAETELYKKVEPKWSEEEKSNLTDMISKIDNIISAEEKREFANNRDDIKWYLKESFLVRSLGQDHEDVHRMKLERDRQVKIAIDILKDADAYKNALSPKK